MEHRASTLCSLYLDEALAEASVAITGAKQELVAVRMPVDIHAPANDLATWHGIVLLNLTIRI